MIRLVALAALLVPPLLPRPVGAADEPPAEVAKLYQQGAREYRLGRFRGALTKFRAALALTDERPSLLFNVAQCHRQLGERRQAVFYYKLYLSEFERLHPAEAAPFASEVKTHLRRLEGPATAPATEPAEAPPPTRPLTATSVPSSPPPRKSPAPFYKRWWFWTVVGAVVAGAATATAIALQPADAEAPTGNLPPGQIRFR